MADKVDNVHVQRLRGNTANNDEYTGLKGELVINEDSKSIRVHDGERKGGFGTINAMHYPDTLPDTVPVDLATGAHVTAGVGRLDGGLGSIGDVAVSTFVACGENSTYPYSDERNKLVVAGWPTTFTLGSTVIVDSPIGTVPADCDVYIKLNDDIWRRAGYLYSSGSYGMNAACPGDGKLYIYFGSKRLWDNACTLPLVGSAQTVTEIAIRLTAGINEYAKGDKGDQGDMPLLEVREVKRVPPGVHPEFNLELNEEENGYYVDVKLEQGKVGPYPVIKEGHVVTGSEFNVTFTPNDTDDGFDANITFPPCNYDDIVDASKDLARAAYPRNAVISGRSKDGYPAYLVNHEFLDMEHVDGINYSKRGYVSASSQYSTTYRPTKPLRNQVVWESNGWLTVNGTKTGWWQYDFYDDAHVLTGMALGVYNNQPTYSLKDWQLQGLNDDGEWENIHAVEGDQPLYGYNGNADVYLRYYWFEGNTKAYKSIRINIDDNNGGAYSSIAVVKFFECPIENMSRFDFALFASERDPFTATLSSSHERNVAFKRTEPVVVDGKILKENTRNYIYLAEKVSKYANGFQYVANDGDRPFSIVADSRRIHYGTEQDIEKECLAMMQSRYTEDMTVPTGLFDHNQGAYNYPVYFNNIKIVESEKFRGANSTYSFTASPKSLMYNGTNIQSTLFDKYMHGVYSNEFTVELDFKFTPLAALSDTYRILFDAGRNSSAGWVISYWELRKCICIYWKGNWYYSAPMNLELEPGWHTLSVSRNAANTLFIHIDGQLAGSFRDTPLVTNGSQFWCIGRWYNSDGNYWTGYINNVRYTLGTCLHQGEDYKVSETFNTSLIPLGTLWWNPNRQCVCEWDGEKWEDMPMTPLGHIDTGWKENLISDQRRGSTSIYKTKGITAFDNSAAYGAAYGAASLFNFGDGGACPYLTANNNTTVDHYAGFTLEEPVALEEVRFCTAVMTEYRQTPVIFKLSAFDEETQEWVELANSDEHLKRIQKMTGLYVAAKYNDFQINGWKSLVIPPEKRLPYKQYKIDFPMKTAAVAPFNGVAYTRTQALFIKAGGTPEILDTKSYCIGDKWSYGPVPATLDQELIIPIPFENLPCDATGYLEEQNDWQTKRRVMGQQQELLSVNFSNQSATRNYYGETVYQARDKFIAQFGDVDVSLPNKYSNTKTVNVSSDYGNVYIVCRRDL